MKALAEATEFSKLRQRMVELQLRARGITDERVLDAMARLPRHEFIHEIYRSQAYEDYPLPIGEGQTISQPYILALMLQALAVKSSDRALEVGTGSGYAMALLAELATEVISIERRAALAERARELLTRLEYDNVKVIIGDGSQGCPKSAPYDVILVSAAVPELSGALVAQLAEGGRMIAPVGQEESQQLQLVHMRKGAPEITLREMCRFVPLVPGY